MTTTVHDFAAEQLMAFVDGELSADAAVVVSAHVAECLECARSVEEFRQLSRAMSGWEVEPVPVVVERAVLKAASRDVMNPDAGVNKNSIRKMTGWRLTVLSFAATATALVIAVGISRSNSRPEMHAFLKPPQAEVESLSPYKPSARSAVALMPEQAAAAKTTDNVYMYDKRSAPSPPAVSASKGKLRNPLANEYAGAASQVAAPMIARTVSMTILVKDFAASRGVLEQVLARHRGYSAQLTVNTQENAARSFQASLRVPDGELAAALGELKALGHVQTETQGGEEVSQQHTDLVARLKNARETEERFQAILRERTGKIEDVLQVEQEIERVRGEIETMEADQKALEHRVDFATIDLQLAEEYHESLNTSPISLSTQMHNALVAGYRNASGTVIGIVLFFAEYGPTLLIFVVIFGAPFVLLRRRYRKAHARLE